ncbi:MAG: RloB family protein [Planctomycetia bacterium]|nr:RloB family protein [Planctomycetia bacterium]
MTKPSPKRTRLESIVPDHNPCNRVLISTEGTKTEPRYFKALNKLLGRGCFVIVPNPDNESSPNCVLKRLADAVDNPMYDFSEEDCDMACLVMDVDEHSTLESTCRQAEEKKFGVYVSNPGFELWLLLHLENVTGGTRFTIDEVTKKLDSQYRRRGRNGYSKTLYDTNILFKGILSAIERARTLDQKKNQVIPENPGANVYRLLDLVADELRDKFSLGD